MTGAHPWVTVTWDRLEPCDVVKAPDGSEWEIVGKISDPDCDTVDVLLLPVGAPDDGPTVWSTRPRAGKVQGWRFRDAPAVPGAETLALGRLRLGGFDVEVVGQ